MPLDARPAAPAAQPAPAPAAEPPAGTAIKAPAAPAAEHKPRGRPFSIEQVLMIRLGAVLIAAFLSFGVFYALFISGDARGHAAEEASDLAHELADSIAPAGDGFRFAVPTHQQTVFDAHQVRYAALSVATGTAVEGSDPTALARLRRALPTQITSTSLTGEASGQTMFATALGDAGGRTFRIGVLEPVSNVGLAWQGVLHEYREEILPTFLPALLLAFGVAWLTVRSSLRPMRRASAEAAAVSVDRPGQRVGLDGVGAEIVPLIEAFNLAVGRLEAALAVQTRFTANAAHEMRTPLAIIRARVDAMPTGAERAALQRDIDRVSRLVSQMLASARLQAGQVGRFEPVELVALARSTLADLVPLAHAENKDLVLESSIPVRVRGNAMSLEGALRNLVENALRFTPPGQAVRVRVGPGPRLQVVDRGPGIPPQHLAQIFEPFWRAHNQRGDGAGLGLAIARDVAVLHGGWLKAENGENQGAIFTLTLGAPAGDGSDGGLGRHAPAGGAGGQRPAGLTPSLPAPRPARTENPDCRTRTS